MAAYRFKICLEENEDIVKLPSDVPIRLKKWDNLNSPSKNKVRRLSVAYVKKYLATIWAKTSGKIKLTLVDAVGNTLFTLFDGFQSGGNHALTLPLSAINKLKNKEGIHVLLLRTSNGQQAKKFLLSR